METQPATDECATDRRHESRDLGLSGPAAVQPCEVETQPDRHADGESCEQLVVERRAGHRRDHDQNA